MKIALSVTKMGCGGIATTVLNLCKTFSTTGHDLTIITQYPGEWWPQLANTEAQGYCLPHPFWKSPAAVAKQLAAYLIEQKFDLLIVFIDFENRLPMLCLHKLPDSFPVVLALRNDFEKIYELAAVNLDAWNCAIAVSPKIQKSAAVRFVHKTIHYIPNGIDWTRLHHLPNRQQWTTPPRLLFVGRLDDHQKGIFRLPAILKLCQQRQLPLRLTIIGDGPDRLQLQQLVFDMGVTALVEFCGAQDHRAVLQAMRTHHIFLMPSNFEGFPNVLLEAQANGCVPVTAHLPDITDVIVQDGHTGIVVHPTDIVAYVDGIQRLLEPTCWQEYSRAGIHHATQHFSLQQVGEKYQALVEELLQNRYPLAIPRTSLRKERPVPYAWKDHLPQFTKNIWRTFLFMKRQMTMNQYQ